MQKSPKLERERGRSLVETVVTMAILGVLVAVASPSFTSALHRSTLTSETNALVSGLALTRSEAIKTGQRVVMCKGTPEGGCTRGPEGWESGWLVFVDVDNDAERDPANPAERLIHAHAGSVRLGISGNTPVRHYVSYSPLGHTRSVSGALQMGTFTLCGKGNHPGEGRQVIISRTGRARLEKISLETCSGP